MQQPPPMMNMMPPFPPNSITTEQIQKYLDENKTLILAILDNQNLGKLAECAQYQAQLQKNLMYLAAIADAQPQAPAMPPSQMPPHPTMQPGGHMMQHPQAGASQQLTGFPPKSPLQFNPQQMQEQQRQQLQHQHHQALQGHMGIRPGVNNGLHGMHTENNLGAGSSGGPSATGGSTGLNDFSRSGAGPGGGTNTSASVSPSPGLGTGASSNSMDAREGKQDGQEAGPDDGQGNSAAGNNSANGEVSNKGPEDAK